MKISFERKIFLGYLFNLIVVLASIWFFVQRVQQQKDQNLSDTLNLTEFFLFFLSVVLLTVVYFIIRAQIRAKENSQNLLLESQKLLQSIIDNTTSPIYIKKINGEYVYVNKQFENLFHITNKDVIGKTDHEFLPKVTADNYRATDIEVVKALKELKAEETIELSDGPHTYIAVKFPIYDHMGRIYAIGGISTDISDRKKLEESLLETDRFFNVSLDIMAIVSTDHFLKINQAASSVLGYTTEELLTNPYYNYVHPEDSDITKNEILKLQGGAVTLNFENRFICKNGQIKFIEWSAYPDVSKGIMYAIGRDVTEQKGFEKQLKVADTFFNMSFDMLVVLEGDYFVKANAAFMRVLGYNQFDLGAKPYVEYIYPDDLPLFISGVRKLQKNDSVVNHRIRTLCKDKSYKWIDWTSTIDLQTGIIYAVARDVTDLVKYEENLKVADSFFNLAFDILVVTKAERFLKTNYAFTKTLGYLTGDLDKLKFSDLTHPDDKIIILELFNKLSKGETMVNFKARLLCKDGSFKWLDWHSNLDVESGILYSVARDISEQVELENAQQIINAKLFENEEKLRLIIENIGEGVLVANADKKIVMANKLASEIFRTNGEAVPYTDLAEHFEIYYPDEKTIFPSQYLPLERALRGESTESIEIVLWNPDTQKKKRVLISGKPLIDQNSRVVAALITIKDISKIKELEDELKDTESKYRELIGYKKAEEAIKKV